MGYINIMIYTIMVHHACSHNFTDWESERLIQDHVKKYKSGAAELKGLIQQVLHGIPIRPQALPLDSDILNVLLSDRIADPEWVKYPYRKAHPILCWLPSKLA
jgi:hypothetical protein